MRVFKSYCQHLYISGSNARLLSQEIATSLRGWALEYRTYPLSFAEYCRFHSIPTERLNEQQMVQLRLAWDDYNRYGGFPEVVLTNDRLLRDKLLQTYYNAMLFRDMVERHGISNIGVLRYFIKRIMNNVTKPTSINSIYNDIRSQGLKVSKDELYKWIDYLCDSFMFIRVPRYTKSLIAEETGLKKWRSLNFPWQAPEVLTKRWCNMIQDRTSFCTFAPMKKEPTTINKDFIISFFLPDGMTDWFEIVGMREEPNGGTAQADVLYSSVLHIYLDERDNRIGDQLGLKPNGFTEATVIKDYPIRNRKVLLHVRRRRYLDADGRNIILNQYPLTADGTKLSVEFGLFFKDGDGQPSVDGSVIGKILSY